MSVSEGIRGRLAALLPRRDRVNWTCPVCARDVKVTPYEREYRIGHAEVCDHCNGGRDA